MMMWNSISNSNNKNSNSNNNHQQRGGGMGSNRLLIVERETDSLINNSNNNENNDQQQQLEYGASSISPPPSSLQHLHHNYHYHSVRFQVVIWYIGPIDVVLGLVTMKFRVTIYWNAPSPEEHKVMSTTGYGNYDASNRRVWTMHGRQRAYQRELHEMLDHSNLVYVPPVSILNAMDFNVVGEPEICLINEQEKTMKWTCMYTASLIQDHIRVDTFPHDEHELVLKLGIMKHRRVGKRWDKRKWKIGLANETDSQQTIRVPHGLIVDHVKIPEFNYYCHKKDDQLQFHIDTIQFGGGQSTKCNNNNINDNNDDRDEYLKVSLRVTRDSGYYDKNIIPLLALLNLVGISTLTLNALEFGSRAEIILAVAFVEMGLRLSVDSKLPQVGYQIKLQRILNRFFYTLLVMHVESSIVYTLIERYDCSHQITNYINNITMIVCGIYTIYQLYLYYNKDYYNPSSSSKIYNSRERR